MSAYVSVAIDGFSKCGKSTLAKMLAERFGLLYIDSGALYRLAAIMLAGKDEITQDVLAFFDAADMGHDGSIYCFGRDYTDEIGSDAVNRSVSRVAQNTSVRSAVKKWIKKKARDASVVIDGRDIGTNVLPNADIKLYLYASIEHRANGWRNRQRRLYGFVDPDLEKKEIENIVQRDYDDLHRSVAPLKCAADAIRFDVEQCPLEEIFGFVSSKIEDLLNGAS